MKKEDKIKNEVVKLYEYYINGATIGQIAKEWKTQNGVISNAFKQAGLKYPRPVISLPISELYESHKEYTNKIVTLREIGLKFNVDYRVITGWFRFLDLPVYDSLYKRKREIDSCFFDEIDSEEKAYVLGLLYADGNVINAYRNKAFKIKLHIDDRELLIKISNILYGKEVLYEYEGNKASTLKISNNKMIKRLVEIGVVPNKTYKDVLIPSIPAELYRHFIRGMFDGDGTVGVYHYNTHFQRHWNIINASKPLLEGIQALLPIKGSIYTKSYKEGSYIKQTIPCYTLSITGIENCKVLYEYLYYKSTIYLQRKKDKSLLTTLTPSELEDLKIF